MQAADLTKTREIWFSALPPRQADLARALLSGLSGLTVMPGPDAARSIVVRYNVLEYRLEDLEAALVNQEFHLDNSLLQKIKRALAYYCEDIQRENLQMPSKTQKTQQIFAIAYDHHPHGDHDETPEEWREYR